jgi:hypothetical protein
MGRVISRFSRILVASVLGLALLGGCGSEGADTDCGLDQCTITFDRGVDAKASVLGIEAELVGVEGDKATVRVAGEELTLTLGQPATEAGGLQVTLESVTDSKAVVKISR